ncbi:MAG: MgtC/SapB family protein [Planctomycetota bacterium]|jgi:putative Mg2+ transporter-C (MgtC) family protein
MEYLWIKLLLSALVGVIIGLEREIRTGNGLRTLTLICLGSTLFTIYSGFFAPDQGSLRIAAAIVTGVGFLGAGMIMHHQGGVIGLVTAATVWLVAALGMGIAFEEYALVAVATGLVLIVLWANPLYQYLTHTRQTWTYEVLIPQLEPRHDDLLALMKKNDLKVSNRSMSKSEAGIAYAWKAYGKPADHRAAMLLLMTHEDVKEFRVI